MKDLIEALQIFLKYSNTYAPTHCEHDILCVMVEWDDLSAEDQVRLNELGFHECMESGMEGLSCSFRFGSA